MGFRFATPAQTSMRRPEKAMEMNGLVDVPQTGRQILEAAIRLYRQIGHRKTTVADIARRMSMSSANIYRFFASKRAIEAAVVAELFREVVTAATEAAERESSAVERLRGVLTTLERVHAVRRADDTKLHELILTSMIEKWPPACAYADAVNSTIVRILADGQARNEFPDAPPQILSECILTAAWVHIHACVAPACRIFPRTTLGQMLEFLASEPLLRNKTSF